jgi:hypothetical protein
MEPTGEKEAWQTSQCMEEWDFGQMQRRSVKDEECSIESFGGNILCFWVEENRAFTEKFIYIHTKYY